MPFYIKITYEIAILPYPSFDSFVYPRYIYRLQNNNNNYFYLLYCKHKDNAFPQIEMDFLFCHCRIGILDRHTGKFCHLLSICSLIMTIYYSLMICKKILENFYGFILEFFQKKILENISEIILNFF